MRAPLNLIADPWLPVRRRSGRVEMIRPAQIVEDLDGDPIVGVGWPRADLCLASYEFLIGLLATAAMPPDEDDWGDLWFAPPSVEQLDAAFLAVKEAFWLDGPGPRFMQDFEELESGREPIERLLIDKCNADLFVHPDATLRYGRAAAAITLFTLQAWAPPGGRGNLTGLRGGGPLVTLVMPREGASLWEIVCANAPSGPSAKPADFPRVFPWLAPTILSGTDGAEVRCGHNAHPLQCWWGMPRRIRLDFEAVSGGVCALTGEKDDVLVAGWRQRPNGPRYANWTGADYGDDATIHPLTPRYQQKQGAEWFSVHPQPGGVGYRHWVGLAIGSGNGLAQPASAVRAWRDRRARVADLRRGMRLFASGYDMDKMKARQFVESEMPLPGTAEPSRQARIDGLARQMVEAAVLVADLLRSSVREALFGKGKVSVDVSGLANVRGRFWERTDPSFFALLDEVMVSESGEGDAALRDLWASALARSAMALFDETVQIDPETGFEAARRAGFARRRIGALAAGAGKDAAALAKVLGQEKTVAQRTGRKETGGRRKSG